MKDGQVAELERLILGIPLVRPETLDVLTRQTRPEDFTYPHHRADAWVH
jgi:replicative DNA helicase